MYSPYKAYRTKPVVPDLPESPPEMSDEEYGRIDRNDKREDTIQAIEKVISNLDDLNHDGKHRHTQKYLENLKEYLINDMEE